MMRAGWRPFYDFEQERVRWKYTRNGALFPSTPSDEDALEQHRAANTTPPPF